MSRVLAAWATPADRETINASPTRKILRNRMRALDSIVEKGFLQIGDIVSSLNVLQKKSLCLWLRDLPPDPGRKYSVRKILSHEDFSCVILCHTEEWHLWTVSSTEKRTRRAGCRTDSNRYGIQESFFGHFKDECPYSECKDIEELRELVARYAEYYNYERRMWDKGRMTPVEYEQYLLAMNEAEFSLYIAKEEEKYQQMKEKAAQRAIERAKNLGV